MALVTCGECGKSVSELASACPSCGAPIQGRAAAAAVGQRVVTTEVTSKRLKLHSLGAAILMGIGIVMLIAVASVEGAEAPAWPAFMLVVGLLWYVVTRFRIWWHHR